MKKAGSPRWIWLGGGIAVVIIAAGIFWFIQHQQAAQPTDYKSALVDSCLKKANDAALQHGTAYNEEQKRVLLQICGCVADQTAQQFTPAEVSAFAANPNDASMLERIKGIMQGCAATAKIPAANP